MEVRSLLPFSRSPRVAEVPPPIAPAPVAPTPSPFGGDAYVGSPQPPAPPVVVSEPVYPVNTGFWPSQPALLSYQDQQAYQLYPAMTLQDLRAQYNDVARRLDVSGLSGDEARQVRIYLQQQFVGQLVGGCPLATFQERDAGLHDFAFGKLDTTQVQPIERELVRQETLRIQANGQDFVSQRTALQHVYGAVSWLGDGAERAAERQVALWHAYQIIREPKPAATRVDELATLYSVGGGSITADELSRFQQLAEAGGF